MSVVNQLRSRVWLLIVLVVITLLVIISLARYDFIGKDVEVLIINENDMQMLSDNYKSFREQAYCLQGRIVGDTAIVTGISEPEQMSTKFMVELEFCKSWSSIGIVHTHPKEKCDLSEEDFYGFGQSKLPLFGVMCDVDKLLIYNNELKVVEVIEKK